MRGALAAMGNAHLLVWLGCGTGRLTADVEASLALLRLSLVGVAPASRPRVVVMVSELSLSGVDTVQNWLKPLEMRTFVGGPEARPAVLLDVEVRGYAHFIKAPRLGEASDSAALFRVNRQLASCLPSLLEGSGIFGPREPQALVVVIVPTRKAAVSVAEAVATRLRVTAAPYSSDTAPAERERIERGTLARPATIRVLVTTSAPKWLAGCRAYHVVVVGSARYRSGGVAHLDRGELVRISPAPLRDPATDNAPGVAGPRGHDGAVTLSGARVHHGPLRLRLPGEGAAVEHFWRGGWLGFRRWH